MPCEQIRALLVYSQLETAISVRSLLTAEGGASFVFFRAERAEEALTRLQRDKYGIVITDYDLQDSDGPNFIAGLHLAAPQTPILVASERADLECALQSVRAGAQDYVVLASADAAGMQRVVMLTLERTRLAIESFNNSSHQLEMKDQFLSQFSHELRSPITAVYQFVTILLDGLAGDLKPEQREYLEITLRNVNLMRDMVRDLMDVTRAQTGKLTIRARCTSVIGIIAETMIGMQSAADARNVVLNLVDLPYVPPVLADPGRIRQILNNLCDNALKFSTAGDTVTVTAHPFEPDNSYLCISVADTGIGISKEGRQQVFEYLYQDQTGLNHNRKGLGIGLAISRELVNQHGGHIWVESEPGKGSIFSFVLPTYSFKEIVAPLFTGRDSAAENVQLVTIELTPGPTAGEVLNESARQRVWEMVERSARAGYEILLPRISSRPTRELLFVVVNDSDPTVVQQLSARLMRDAQLDETMIRISITAQAIGESHGQDDDTVDVPSESDISAALQRAIETRTSE